MPVHHVPKHSVHEDVRDIERQGEVIVSVADAGDRWAIFTSFERPAVETRLAAATHAARVGAV